MNSKQIENPTATATASRERIPTIQEIEGNQRCYLTAHRHAELPDWVHRKGEALGLCFSAFQNMEGRYLLVCSSAGAHPPLCLKMRQIPPIHRPTLKSYIADFRTHSAMINALAYAD